ncbi:lipid-A-disaccharide synthase [Gloeothece citriformis PCC 7424]|uniref:Lipid-A-disaccharide synthase n=1 Tax=Gloeothece citriformis (strain PCC 7424) TaxID=65393 RepID=LPXB_GLOC7|nr:lipid-A-disaccharide synthase [Gloeothece citriformis]B7KFS1.1 RecName: Full=Lipid-A-disaccharide synthase [Gloeothece citriformis PCC 7424]ACK73396.1 lipid-A-disaccharide synthase [Gloeothece citriformis PCC 7424]
MRIFISTGEVSGDLQGAMLIEALKRQAALKAMDLEIVALGGDRMAETGVSLLGKTPKIASIGLIEALPFIMPTWKLQRKAKQYLQENPPDLLILIDYCGPNVAIGKYARKNIPQVPILYYIAPQAWVWTTNKKTTQDLVNITDHLLAIFSEEARYFAQKGMSVSWVGHPILDRMAQAPTREEARQKLGIKPDQTAIALLPVSRKQELKYLLPVVCQAAQQIQEKLPDVQFLIPLALEDYRSTISAMMEEYGLQGTILDGKSLDALAAADLAIAKSGTVNLELALLNVPQVVVYRLTPLTLWIAQNILKFSVPFLSPVNLVVMEEVVPELFQERATPEQIVQESLDLLLNPQRRQKTLSDYQRVREELGEVGVCDRAAQEILDYV